MAVVTRYVNTASSGGDGTTNGEGAGGTNAYASLNAWEAAEQADLSGDQHVVNCGVGSGSAADSTAVFISGWTNASATDFITIQANPADTGGNQTAQMPWDTNIYRFSLAPGSDNARFRVGEPYTVLAGLQIEGVKTTASTFNNRALSLEATNCLVDSCYARVGYTNGSNPAGADTDQAALNIVAGATSCVVVNSVLHVQANGGAGKHLTHFLIDADETCTLYNLTCVMDGDASVNILGISPSSGKTATCKNVLVERTVSGGSTRNMDYRTDAGTITDTNCAASDATLSGTGARTNQTYTFINAGTGDFHLDSADAGARTFGTSLVADGTYPFSVDFDGETRVAWDIGADEVLTGGATVSTAPAVAYAPTVSVGSAASRAVFTAAKVAHAPGIAATSGAASRSVDTTVTVVHAPQADIAGTTQSVAVAVTYTVTYAPSAYSRIEPEYPLTVTADSTITRVGLWDWY